MRRECLRCGATFTPHPTNAERGGGKWCSWSCYRPPFDVVVWERLDIGDCWEWTGPTDREGYGIVAAEHGGLIHRAIWLLLVGPIEDGQPLDHLCRNRRCANPDHLEPVTHRENILRGFGPAAKYAKRSRCVRGHALTGPQADVTMRPGQGRRCNVCNRDRVREWREARRC